MSSSVRLSVVCLSVVCNVRAPYSGYWNFRQCSTPFGTLAICDLSIKILRRSSQGNPSGGLNKRGVAKYSNFGFFQGYISETVQWAKLVLITNRKSHMSFRLIGNRWPWMTLNGVIGLTGCLISPNSVDFWADCVKVVEDTRILSAAEMWAENVVFNNISFMAILQGITPSESVKWGTPLSLAKIWRIISYNLEMVQDRR